MKITEKKKILCEIDLLYQKIILNYLKVQIQKNLILLEMKLWKAKK
jgi:hypothetical protein